MLFLVPCHWQGPLPRSIFALQNYNVMKVKETIAFIGEADKTCNQLIERLAAENYPLVLVAKEGNHFEELSGQILNRVPEADIEVINCEREGCWEADVIVFDSSVDFNTALVGKIKEVTNQKILIYVLDKTGQPDSINAFKSFQQLLPTTQWVQLTIDPVSHDIQIAGDEKAKAAAEKIFNPEVYASGN